MAKDKGSEELKERCRKDSGSSVGCSVGSVESGWGKQREREMGMEVMMMELVSEIREMKVEMRKEEGWKRNGEGKEGSGKSG